MLSTVGRVSTSLPSRPRRRDAVENRAGILAAATASIAADPHASLDTIARAAGVSRRALYGHFDDRAALVREVIAAGSARFNATSLTVAADVSTGPAPLALARLTARLWSEAAHVQALAAIALDETHVAETAEALAPLRQGVLDIVRRGQHEGTLRTDVAAPTLARLVEETARTVITRVDASSPIARSLAVRAVLSIAGLSWREADALLTAHPDLLSAD